jgi:hypothetical protein
VIGSFRSADHHPNGGALHSASQLQRVSTPQNRCSYRIRIDATPVVAAGKS